MEFLKKFKNDPNFKHFALTFFDPPFNQGKEYAETRDDLPEKDYWKWMKEILQNIHDLTIEGGSIYFMQREKNAEQVLSSLRETGSTFQNLIIWKKLT